MTLNYSQLLPRLVLLIILVWSGIVECNIVESVLKQYYDTTNYPKLRRDADNILLGLCSFELQHPKSFIYQCRKDTDRGAEWFMQRMQLIGLTINLDERRGELVADWFVAAVLDTTNSHTNLSEISSTLKSFSHSATLSFGHSMVASSFECWTMEPQINGRVVFTTLSCAFSVAHIDQLMLMSLRNLSYTTEIDERFAWSILLQDENHLLREHVPLCPVKVSNALVDYYMRIQDRKSNDNIKSDNSMEKGERYYHSLVGCSRLLSNVDRLERLWPGIMSQWIMYHIYLVSMGYLSIYDSDGSAWEYVKPFVKLGYVRYYGEFLESKRDKKKSPRRIYQTEPAIISNNTDMQLLIDNHCMWESKGRTEWVVMLRYPSHFLTDDVVGGYHIYSALDNLNKENVVAKLDRVQHTVRLFGINPNSSIFSSYPYIELGSPRRKISVIDPHRISTLFDNDGEDLSDQITQYGSTNIVVHEYPMIFQNTTFQSNDLWMRQSGTNERITEEFPNDNSTKFLNKHVKGGNCIHVIDPATVGCFELLQADGHFFHKKILNFYHVDDMQTENSRIDMPNRRVSCTQNCTYHIVLVGPGLMDIPPFGWGSVENIIWNYYLELIDYGHDVKIINNPEGPEVIEKILALTIDKKRKLDVLHIQTEMLAHIANDLIDTAHIILITMHNAFLTSPTEWQEAYNRFLDGVAISARSHSHIYFFVVSPNHKDWLISYWNIPSDRVYVVPNGVEVSKYHLYLPGDTNPLPHGVIPALEGRNEMAQTKKSVSIGIIIKRKGQWYLQSILSEDSIDFIGTPDSNHGNFNFSSSNYLAGWEKQLLYENLTYYGNLVHLATAEAAAPLVVLEAMAAGLGVVITKNASSNLDLSKPFITVIPDDRIRDANYIREAIVKNREISHSQRREIRQYVEDNFAWSTAIIPRYLGYIKELLEIHRQQSESDSPFPSSRIIDASSRNISKSAFDWANKYAIWRRYHTSLNSEIAPYLVVVTLVENFSVVLFDWIELMRTLGADYFVLYTLRDHDRSLRALLNHHIKDGLVEIQFVNDFPYFHDHYHGYDALTNITAKKQMRRAMFFNPEFHRQICNEAVSVFRLTNTKWMTVLYEQDYLFEDLTRYSLITRNALLLFLKQEEQRATDVIVVEGMVTNKVRANVSYYEHQQFLPVFASRCITYIPRTVHHGLMDVGCISMEPCNIKTIHNNDGVFRPFYFMALDMDYLWQLPQYANASNHNLLPLPTSISASSVDGELSNEVDENIQYLESELDKEATLMVKEFLGHQRNIKHLTDVTESRLATVDICAKSPILFVSYFRDIGRANWEIGFSRNVIEYLEHFVKLVETTNHPLIFYTDRDTVDLLHEMLVSRQHIWRQYREEINIIFRDINDVQSTYDQYLDLHEEIIASDDYQKLIPSERKNFPEHRYGQYTAATNSKIDYLAAARKEFQSCSYYAFIDFGFCRQAHFAPFNVDVGKLTPNKIILPAMTMPDMQNILSRSDLLATDEIYIEGSTFIVPNAFVSYYHQLWRDELGRYYAEKIVDDDQSIAYQIVMNNPHLFVLVRNGRWFQMYSAYLNQKVSPTLSQIDNHVQFD